jgi:hypothetical protein
MPKYLVARVRLSIGKQYISRKSEMEKQGTVIDFHQLCFRSDGMKMKNVSPTPKKAANDGWRNRYTKEN